MDRSLKKVLIIGGLVLASVITLGVVMANNSGWHGTGWGMMGGTGTMGGFGMIRFMAIFWIAILGFIIWAVVAGARGASQTALSSNAGSHDSAMDILKTKYARGEISREEYEEKKKDLL